MESRTDPLAPDFELRPPSRDGALPPGLDLCPPDSSADHPGTEPSGHGWVWVVAGALVLASLAVVWLLPGYVSDPGQSRPVPVGEPVSPPAPPAADDSNARAGAEQALQAYLRVRARLELANAPAWGDPEWPRALAAAGEADRLFGKRDFTGSAQAYRRTVEVLEILEGQRLPRLESALGDARRALQADDAEKAAERFELALAIQPDHEEALAGLVRARSRPQVLRHMERGGAAEQTGELASAGTAYAEAAGLDPAYRLAAEALERVHERIAEGDFRKAMGDALTALDSGKLTRAAEALNAAARLRPEDATLRDLRRRLQAARHRAGVARLRTEAKAGARAEDWARAAARYQQLLALEAGADFARRGLANAQEREALHRRLDGFLEQPGRVYSAGPLEEAEGLLAAFAGENLAGEPRLGNKLEALRALVSQARTAVAVTLRSDGQTDVVIYHVGRLGRFQALDLDLRPGTYTAVGSRAGYRDVRQVFIVAPASPPAPVVIRCEEPI